MTRSPWKPIGWWLLAIGVAVAMDYSVARWIDSAGVADALRRDKRHSLKWLGLAGEYGSAAVLAAVAGVCFTRDRARALALVLLAGAVTLGNGPAKWMVGRARPYRTLTGHETPDVDPFSVHPFFGGWGGIEGVASFSFPSAQALLAFATAAAMAMLFPRLRWLFYALAALTAVERVLENAHYLSDVVAAAALGVGVAHLLHRLLFVRLTDRVEPAAQAAQPMLTTTPP